MKPTSIKVSVPVGSLFQKIARQADANRGLELPPASERKAQVELSWQELDRLAEALEVCSRSAEQQAAADEMLALKARLTSIRNRL